MFGVHKGHACVEQVAHIQPVVLSLAPLSLRGLRSAKQCAEEVPSPASLASLPLRRLSPAAEQCAEKVAALLLGKGRVVHATHQQLADELGSVREMVSRLLKGFAEQGLVALGREQIEIRDAAGLRRIAEAV